MSLTDKQITGRLGEDAAVKYLKKNGYCIKDRNIHVSRNEIDIIAEDQEYIVFVEVKTRSLARYGSFGKFGSAGRAVDSQKRKNTVEAATSYLREHFSEKTPRIDVIEVYVGRGGSADRVIDINHIRNAFDARGRKH